MVPRSDFFEATNSVFKKTNENNSFSINMPGHWQAELAEKTIDELDKPLELKSQKGIKLHVKEVRKRGNQIKLGDNEHNLSDFDTQENEIPEEMENVKYSDLEDLVYRFQLTYDEIIDVLDLKYNPQKNKPLTSSRYLRNCSC